jgi:hypothetical protein
MRAVRQQLGPLVLHQAPVIRTLAPVMAGPRPGHRLPAPICERCNPTQQPSDGDSRVKPGYDGVGSVFAVRQQQGPLVLQRIPDEKRSEVGVEAVRMLRDRLCAYGIV